MRCLYLVGLATLGSTFCIISSRSHAGEPTKPIQECEQEFLRRQASLHSEGVSAASFFHECWWHSRHGHPTELSSDDARDRAQRIQSDPAAERLWTEGKAIAQTSTSDNRRSASLSDRRKKRREARLQRRMNRIIAARAQGLVLAARVRHRDDKRVAIARPRENTWHRRIREERLAALSRRNAERRERYALSRVHRDNADRPVIEASISIPANSVEGRRSWIGTNTEAGPTKIPAVMVGAVQSQAVKGTALHCWDQKVLFLAGNARWQQALVCDDKTEAGAQKIWFEQYDARR